MSDGHCCIPRNNLHDKITRRVDQRPLENQIFQISNIKIHGENVKTAWISRKFGHSWYHIAVS